jgi:hypothetical protein
MLSKKFKRKKKTHDTSYSQDDIGSWLMAYEQQEVLLRLQSIEEKVEKLTKGLEEIKEKIQND